MRILLDECLPRRLALRFTGHEATTVPAMGWAGVKNGDLLARAAGGFDAFVTIDRSMTFQQNIERFKLVLVVLHAKSNRLADVEPLVPEILRALESVAPGNAVHIGR